jgi:hypothetical protein
MKWNPISMVPIVYLGQYIILRAGNKELGHIALWVGSISVWKHVVISGFEYISSLAELVRDRANLSWVEAPCGSGDCFICWAIDWGKAVTYCLGRIACSGSKFSLYWTDLHLQKLITVQLGRVGRLGGRIPSHGLAMLGELILSWDSSLGNYW